MSTRLMALRQKRAAVRDKAREMTAAADDAGIDLTEEENTKIDALIAEGETIQASIEREEKVADLDRSVATLPGASDSPIQATEMKDKDGKGGFKSFGDFSQSVMAAGLGNGFDDRLVKDAAAPTTFGNEGTGADGGFLVPPDFSNDMTRHSLEEDAFLPMTDNTDISGNSMVFPSDETTPWGTNGIRAYWEAEAAAATQTKPDLKANMMRLHKLLALVPVTDELMADAAALSSYLISKTGESIRWKTNDSLINGSGAGMPLGILNAGALVTVAKVGSQTADTVNATNVLNMFARMPASAMRTAMWIINNNVLPQLSLMTIGDKPIWLPPTNLIGGLAGTMLGRPVALSQSCQTLGDKGDIFFSDWKSYHSITKTGGIEFATSIHLFFDAGATAFRATFRVDGQPWLSSSITPNNGTDNLSPFVTLAERA